MKKGILILGVITLAILIFAKNTQAEIATTTDWIGLFTTGTTSHTKAGTIGGNTWKYSSNCSDLTPVPGTAPKLFSDLTTPCQLTAPANAPGIYELRMYANNKETSEALISQSRVFSVGFKIKDQNDLEKSTCDKIGTNLNLTIKWPVNLTGGISQITINRSDATGHNQTFNISPYSGESKYDDIMPASGAPYTYYLSAQTSRGNAASHNKVLVQAGCTLTFPDYTPPVSATPTPTVAYTPLVSCPTTGNRIKVDSGLLSTRDLSFQTSSTFSTSNSYCVIGNPAALPQFSLPIYAEMKSLYYDQIASTVSRFPLPAAGTGDQVQTSTSSPINLTGSSSGPPVGLWRLDEATATNAVDSGGTNTLTANGTTVTTGHLNNARSFNGTSDSLSANDPTNGSLDFPGTGGWTISAWIKTTANKRQMIISKDSNAAGGRSYNLFLTGPNVGVDVFASNTSATTTMTTLQSVNDGKWHHLAASYSYITNGTSTLTIYVDGAPVKSASNLVGPIQNSVAAFSIGARTYAGYFDYFNGQIDDARVYNYAISNDQALALYQGINFSADKLYWIKGDLTVNSDITVNKTGVIFIDDDLSINTNLANNSLTAGLVFIVGGDVKVNPSVDKINAFIITFGEFCSAFQTGDTSCQSSVAVDKQLIIKGSVISLGDASKQPKFVRTLNASNNSTSAEQVNYDVKFLAIVKTIFSRTRSMWAELTAP